MKIDNVPNFSTSKLHLKICFHQTFTKVFVGKVCLTGARMELRALSSAFLTRYPNSFCGSHLCENIMILCHVCLLFNNIESRQGQDDGTGWVSSHVDVDVDGDVDVDNDDEQGAQVRQGQDGAGCVASQGDGEIERNKLGGRRQGAPNKLYLMMMFMVIK